MAAPLVIGTRGSQLALWQAEWVRAQTRAPLSRGCRRALDHQDPGRQDPGRPARPGRRQGALRQGDRGGPARRPRGPGGPQHEGHAGGDPGRSRDRRGARARDGHRRPHLPRRAAPAGDRGRRGDRHQQPAARGPAPSPAARTSTVVPLRGNVETRIAKLDAGELAGIVLAAAGLKRLGLAARASEHLDADACSRPSARGRCASRSARDDPRIGPIVAALDHRASRRVVMRRAGLSAAAPGRVPGPDRRPWPH